MKISAYEAIIEAILFVAGEPVTLVHLAQSIGQDTKSARVLVETLRDRYISEKRGMLILEIEDSYQMCTNPAYFEYVKNLYQKVQKKVLTQTLLETLAIIAYKQPVTKAQIEEIRGVSADHAVNRLIEYRLVSEAGRLDVPGKPILFGTSDEFLKYFGFNSLSQLPKLEKDTDALKKEVEEEIEGVHKKI